MMRRLPRQGSSQRRTALPRRPDVSGKPSDVLIFRVEVVLLLTGLALSGCGPSRQPPNADDLPSAYPRGQINDPKLAEAAQGFATWAKAQVAEGQPIYQRVEILPPADTLLPYGIGAFQKETRLPAILTVGQGWQSLKPQVREETLATAFRELVSRLTNFAIKPTLTVQTSQGLELAWVNDLIPGQKLLHGED